MIDDNFVIKSENHLKSDIESPNANLLLLMEARKNLNLDAIDPLQGPFKASSRKKSALKTSHPNAFQYTLSCAVTLMQVM